MRALLFLMLLGCTVGKSGDTGNSDTGNPTDTGDSVDTATCNTDNEDCTRGTCGGEGKNMLPGSDCMACHTSGGGEASTWTVAGTLFTDSNGASGQGSATIHITDVNGNSVDLTTSSSGNFYTSEHLTPPLNASVETSGGTRPMSSAVSTGACNSCHLCGGAAGGKMYPP